MEKIHTMTKLEQIAQQAREYLSTLDNSEILSTRELVTSLDLQDLGEPHRIASLLCRLALDDLSDCADRGEPVMGKNNSFHRGKLIRPWLWHCPKVGISDEQIRLAEQAYNAGYEDGLTSPPVGHRFEAFVDKWKERYMLETRQDVEIKSRVREIVYSITRDQIVDSINHNTGWKSHG